jgi:Flp pilus assembly protein TadG
VLSSNCCFDMTHGKIWQRRVRKQQGSVLLLFLLTLVPICGVVGLVADIGWYYYTAETAHAAAEAAATAAVRSAMDYVSAGAAYGCSSTSNGILCQAAMSCPSVIASPMTNDLQAGCAYAAANGFTNGGMNGKQTVTIEANTTTPAPTAPGVKVRYWVTVRIYQANPLFFLGIFSQSSLAVAVRSTAAVLNKVPNACVATLDPTARSALMVTGSASVTLSNCAVQVNSNATTALNVNGSACLSATAIDVVGGASTTSCTQPAPISSSSAMSDPFAALAAPSFSTTCDSAHTNVKVNSNSLVTLSPGTYCGGLSITSSVALTSGTYVLLGGGLTCNAGCSLTGSGVTFYNTCTSGYCNGGSSGYKAISIGGQGVVNLSAPSSGDLAGILFFQDRSVSPPSGQSDSILGGSSTNVQGVMYFPETLLKFAGNFSGADSSTFLIADQISFAGTSSLQISSTGPTPAWAPVAALIE